MSLHNWTFASIHNLITKQLFPERQSGIWSIQCSWHCGCWNYFFLALANNCPWGCMPFSQISQWTVNLKILTIPLGIVASFLSSNLSRNSCKVMDELNTASLSLVKRLIILERVQLVSYWRLLPDVQWRSKENASLEFFSKLDLSDSKSLFIPFDHS